MVIAVGFCAVGTVTFGPSDNAAVIVAAGAFDDDFAMINAGFAFEDGKECAQREGELAVGEEGAVGAEFLAVALFAVMGDD